MIDSLVRVSRRDGEVVITWKWVTNDISYSTIDNHTHTFAHVLMINNYGQPPQHIHHSTTPTLNPSTISSTISLFFQSAFHLSLTVLVRYRSPEHI